MKLTTNTESLVSALARLKTVIPSRATLPILGNVRILANGTLRIAANNLDQGLEMTLDAEISQPGEFTVPCNALHAALSCMDGAAVSLTKEKDSVVIACGSQTAKMRGLPVEEFPPISKREGESITIPGEKLKRWLGCCIPAASVDQTRYTLNGVHLTERGNALAIEATDGHRLVVIDSEIQCKFESCIIPMMGAQIMAAMAFDGDVSISQNESVIFACGDRWEFATRKIEGNFPGVQQYLAPRENTKSVTVVREDLIRAAKYASLFVSDAFSAIRLISEPGCMTVAAQSQLNDGSTRLDGFPKNPKITIGAKPAYAIDLLRCFTSEEVSLEVIDPSSPIIVRQEGITAVLMTRVVA